MIRRSDAAHRFLLFPANPKRRAKTTIPFRRDRAWYLDQRRPRRSAQAEGGRALAAAQEQAVGRQRAVRLIECAVAIGIELQHQIKVDVALDEGVRVVE